jgi:large subunit ribosomal protein L23
MDATEIILQPLVTEKSTAQSTGRLNTYAFKVADAASKVQIRQAVEKLYNVKVADVRTLNRKGKPQRTKTGYKMVGDYKRAIVKLAEGSKIELF